MIYLRTHTDVYEAARAQIDAARGLPSRGQVTSFDAAATAPKDTSGRVLLGLRESDLTASGAEELLSHLLSAGLVEIIDEETYRQSFTAEM